MNRFGFSKGTLKVYEIYFFFNFTLFIYVQL